jgi:hypothetical protein
MGSNILVKVLNDMRRADGSPDVDMRKSAYVELLSSFEIIAPQKLCSSSEAFPYFYIKTRSLLNIQQDPRAS